MKEKPDSEALRWYLQAEQDRKDAEYLLEGNRYNLACLLAQQSVEKALKAYLYSRPGVESARGHSVSALCEEAAGFDPNFSEWSAKVAPLDKYYLTSRYPNSLPGGIPSKAFNREEAVSSLEVAAGFLAFVHGKL